MKKGLIGCLVVGLLLLVVGAGVAYWVFLRPAWNAVSAGADAAQEWSKVADLEGEVKNQDAFVEPSDGHLTPAQVATYAKIQDSVRAKLGGEFDAMKAKYDAMQAKIQGENREASASEGLQAMSDLSALMAKAKQAQVEALNEQGMSLAEYRWIHGQVLSALPLAGMETVPEQLQNGPEAFNAGLLRPHKDIVEKTMSMVWLGM